MSLNVAKFLKSKQAENYQAIVKDIGGRRFLLGFERKNKASRKYKEKLMCPFPVNLDQIVADYERTKQQVLAQEAQSTGGASQPADNALPAVGKSDLAYGK